MGGGGGGGGPEPPHFSLCFHRGGGGHTPHFGSSVMSYTEIWYQSSNKCRIKHLQSSELIDC